MLLLLNFGVRVDYLTQVLPGILLFSLGLSITVAPLTAAILAGVDQSEAGIGSAVNNAVARVAGLIATVAIGAVVAAQFSSSLDHQLAGQPFTPRGTGSHRASQAAHIRTPPGRRSPAPPSRRDHRRIGPVLARGLPGRHRRRQRLVIIGGLIGAAGIRNPRRVVRASHAPAAARRRPARRRGLHASEAA